jgi:TonB family protein
MFFALAAALLQAAAPGVTPAAPPPGVLTSPDWLHRPTGADLASVFPREAAYKGIEGLVTLMCRVSLEGAAVDCAIENEEPIGHGFGAAALQLSSKFKLRPQTKNGIPDGGGRMRIPISFFLPDARLEPIAATYPGIRGHAEVHCRVSSQRRLEGCIIARTPANDLLDDLALKVAAQVTLPASTQVGLRIVVPVDITPPVAPEPSVEH